MAFPRVQAFMGLTTDLAHHFLEAVDQAAIASAAWRGKGDKNAADDAAVEAMRRTFDNVLRGRVTVPPELDHHRIASEHAANLIDSLLCPDVGHRLGSARARGEIRAHPPPRGVVSLYMYTTCMEHLEYVVCN